MKKKKSLIDKLRKDLKSIEKNKINLNEKKVIEKIILPNIKTLNLNSCME